MLYERTALSRKPQALIERELGELREVERMTPDLVMRDPYMLDFLELHDSYLESDLEAAIVREMERFLLELDRAGIHVAEYLTALPTREVLAEKLQQAANRARRQVGRRVPGESTEGPISDRLPDTKSTPKEGAPKKRRGR